MNWWRRFTGRTQFERDLDAELRYHLERLVEDNIRAGMSPAAARRLARLQFGGDDQLKEGCRDVRRVRWLSDLLQDARYGSRLLINERWFTATAVLTLGLGMAVTAMMTTILNGYYFRGLPGEHSDRILSIGTQEPAGRERGLSLQEYQDLHRASRSFTTLGAFGGRVMTISEPGSSPENVAGRYISASSFRLLGTEAFLGRTFREEDERAGAAPVVILGHRLWSSRYGGEPDVIGRVVRVNGHPSTVIGVMPEGFEFPYWDILWQPLTLMPGLAAQARDERTLDVFGLLARGTSARQARAELDSIAARWTEEYPQANPSISLTAVRFGEQQVGRFGETMPPLILTATAIFVLLIACANLAGLLLARAAGRVHEIGIRTAVGATRWRIIRQLLLESLLLAFAGGTLGLALSRFGVAFIADAFAGNVPYWMEFNIDGRVLLVLTGLCLFSAVLFGLAPALHVSRTDVVGPMQAGARGALAPRAAHWTRALLAVEVAITLSLLAGAALMVRSFLVLHQADRVVRAEGLLSMRLDLPESRYAGAEARASFYDQLEQRLMMSPAIASTTVADTLPFLSAPERRLAMRRPEPDQRSPTVSSVAIGERYFEVLGVPLLRGRAFTELDGTAGRATVIVNQRLVERYFAGEDPLGRHILLFRDGVDPGSAWHTIVGVSPAIRQGQMGPTQPIVYLPLRGAAGQGATLIVRPRGDVTRMASMIRREIAAIDSDVPVFSIKPLTTARDNSRLEPRVMGTLLAGFAAIALVLAAVGLYSVTAYAVRQRRQEIGVRMALGAQRRQVVWLVLWRGMLPVAVGVGLGLLGAVAVGQVLRGLLIETSATDPLVLVSIVSLLFTITAAACFLPARRAARMDPLGILRRE